MAHRPLAHAAASVRSSSWLRSNVQPLRPVCRPQSCQLSSAAPAKHCFARVVLPQLVSCGYAVAPERDGAVGPQGTEKASQMRGRWVLCGRSWCLRRWHTCPPEMNIRHISRTLAIVHLCRIHPFGPQPVAMSATRTRDPLVSQDHPTRSLTTPTGSCALAWRRLTRELKRSAIGIVAERWRRRAAVIAVPERIVCRKQGQSLRQLNLEPGVHVCYDLPFMCFTRAYVQVCVCVCVCLCARERVCSNVCLRGHRSMDTSERKQLCI